MKIVIPHTVFRLTIAGGRVVVKPIKKPPTVVDATKLMAWAREALR